MILILPNHKVKQMSKLMASSLSIVGLANPKHENKYTNEISEVSTQQVASNPGHKSEPESKSVFRSETETETDSLSNVNQPYGVPSASGVSVSVPLSYGQIWQKTETARN